MKRFLARVITGGAQWAGLRVLRVAARWAQDPKMQPQSEQTISLPLIPDDQKMTPLVLMLAGQDAQQAFMERPEAAQAELNRLHEWNPRKSRPTIRLDDGAPYHVLWR